MPLPTKARRLTLPGSDAGPTHVALGVVHDPRWASVQRRAPEADGAFVYSVETTGIYCRPSCPSRTARPENVAFHDGPEGAERAGFRACKRCEPKGVSPAQRQAALVAELCRHIEGSVEEVSLRELAQQAGLSIFHTQRLFKKVTGLTPKAYGAAHRARRFQTELRAQSSVTSALHEAGYGSSARAYESSNARLGMTPSEYRAGGKDIEMKFAVGDCSLGSILVAATDRGVSAIFMGDSPEELVHELERRFPGSKLAGDDPTFALLVAEVIGLVEKPRKGADLPLDIRGTAFQERVWQALRAIPSGTTVSYSTLAESIGAPKAVRAVAGACAANSIAVLIPCHRVVRTDGSLSGYRWGVERKRTLIDRETRET